MEMKMHATLKLVAPKSFINKDNEKIVYNEHYFDTLSEEGGGDILILNSKRDFSEKIGEAGVASVRLEKVSGSDANGKPLKGAYRIRLVDFVTE